jgi:hypothetical protein
LVPQAIRIWRGGDLDLGGLLVGDLDLVRSDEARLAARVFTALRLN